MTNPILGSIAGGVFACLALFSCRLPAPKAQAIASVKEAVEHPRAEYLSFTAYARTELLGIHTWRNPPLRGSFDGEGPDPFVAWALPVFDTPSGGGEDVHLWLTRVGSGRNLKNGIDLPEDWCKVVEEGFQGQPVTAKVMVRAADGRGSAWESAIKDAEERYGLRSHPLAPVVAWPPAGR